MTTVSLQEMMQETLARSPSRVQGPRTGDGVAGEDSESASIRHDQMRLQRKRIYSVLRLVGIEMLER